MNSHLSIYREGVRSGREEEQAHIAALQAELTRAQAEVNRLRREMADLKIFAYERAPKIAAEEANRQIEPLKEEIERLRVALEEIRDKRLPQVCEDYENCAHVGCEASYAAFAIADKALRKEEGANNVLQ